MPEIGNIMDVTIDDLSPEQQAQLKDAIDQFQLKCLMSFGKNRSGVPYLKSEMPRVLLPREPDTTSFQEKQEALNAFQEATKAVMGKHHDRGGVSDLSVSGDKSDLVVVDPHDPTTTSKTRSANAITKPTPDGYRPCWRKISLITKINSCTQSKNEQESEASNLNIT
jgi:hypothetical protein